MDNAEKKEGKTLWSVMTVMKAKMKEKLNQSPKMFQRVKTLRNYKNVSTKLGARSLDYSKRKNSKYFIPAIRAIKII